MGHPTFGYILNRINLNIFKKNNYYDELKLRVVKTNSVKKMFVCNK